MHVVLISTYELGHQPFGLASPAAWLRAAGASVRCLDLAVEALDPSALQDADLIACYVPMHTATRLVIDLLPHLQRLRPTAHLACFGLYAPVNEPYLRQLGVQTILGGEFERGLVDLYRQLDLQLKARTVSVPVSPSALISLAKQAFITPDRSTLPPLSAYAFLQQGDARRTVGYTEASRGCKHLCRHCPIVPIYGGRFRVIGRDVVLADIRQQVAAGAQHITFGDPDFLNGPGHVLPIVEALHHEFPALTYDATIKVEHLLRHADLLPTLRATGCVLITSAVEALDDPTLEIFDKRHTRADVVRAVALLREAGIALNPTFVTFSPWTTLQTYRALLQTIAELDLIAHVAPIQYAIRLLIPAGSRLLELSQVRNLIGPFDPAALCYPWQHPDPAVDQLYADVRGIVQHGQRQPRRAVFDQIWRRVTGETLAFLDQAMMPRPPVPQLSEPWYC